MYQTPEPNDEMLECFDDQGNTTEPHTRQEVHAEPLRYWHAVVNVWLVNPKLQILCSKRSEALKGNPGKWQTYFGGHVKAGKTFKQALAMELDEEVGLQVQDSKLCLVSKGSDPKAKHFYESYAYVFEGSSADLKFNDGEITEVKWFTMEEYWEQKQLHPENWCNSCKPEDQEKIRQCLAAR